MEDFIEPAGKHRLDQAALDGKNLARGVRQLPGICSLRNERDKGTCTLEHSSDRIILGG
jgi:hypothetical protein